MDRRFSYISNKTDGEDSGAIDRRFSYLSDTTEEMTMSSERSTSATTSSDAASLPLTTSQTTRSAMANPAPRVTCPLPRRDERFGRLERAAPIATTSGSASHSSTTHATVRPTLRSFASRVGIPLAPPNRNTRPTESNANATPTFTTATIQQADESAFGAEQPTTAAALSPEQHERSQPVTVRLGQKAGPARLENSADSPPARTSDEPAYSAPCSSDEPSLRESTRIKATTPPPSSGSRFSQQDMETDSRGRIREPLKPARKWRNEWCPESPNDASAPASEAWKPADSGDYSRIKSILSAANWYWTIFASSDPAIASTYISSPRHLQLLQLVEDVNENLAPDQTALALPQYPAEYALDFKYDLDVIVEVMVQGEVRVLREEVDRELVGCMLQGEQPLAFEQRALRVLVVRVADLVKWRRMKVTDLRLLGELVRSEMLARLSRGERKVAVNGCDCEHCLEYRDCM